MKTPVILLFIHTVAFLFLLAGQIAPGPVTNAIVMLGLVFEFLGWLLGLLLFKSPPPLAFTFFSNAILYFAGGLVIEWGTRRRKQQPSN